MNGLDQIYFACCGIGFIYIIGTALAGHMHEGHDAGHHDAGHGHHGADGHGTGSHGHHDGAHGHGSSQHDSSHQSSDGHNNSKVSHHGLAHTAPHSVPQASDLSGHGHNPGSHPDQSPRADLSSTTQNQRMKSSDDEWYFKLLYLVSPMRLSLFLFFFGAGGVFTLRLLPTLGPISLVPALLFGIISSKVLFGMLSMFLSKLNASTNFQDDSLIGAFGELTLSIPANRTGEVIISSGSGRHTGPAKAYKAGQEINKLSKVIISDYRDGIFYVEPYDQDLFSKIEIPNTIETTDKKEELH